jgi:hypothetical protein
VQLEFKIDLQKLRICELKTKDFMHLDTQNLQNETKISFTFRLVLSPVTVVYSPDWLGTKKAIYSCSDDQNSEELRSGYDYRIACDEIRRQRRGY